MILEKPADEFLQVFITSLPSDHIMVDELEAIIECQPKSSPRVLAQNILDVLEDKYGVRIE